MEYFSVVVSVGLFYVIGFLIFSLCRLPLNFIEKTAYAFGLGGGIVSVQMFLYIHMSVPLYPIAIVLPWIIVILFYGILVSNTVRINKLSRGSWVQYSLLFLIFCNIFYVFVESQLRPLQSWDAVSHWSFLSKAVFTLGTLDGAFYRFANFDVPYLISFQEAFVYLLNKSVTDKTVLILFPFYFLNIIFLFYTSVRKFLTKQSSLFFTFLLASLPNLLRQAGTYDIGYVDIALAYYVFASVMLFLQFVKGNRNVLWILSFFLGFSSIVKGEGQAFLGIMTVLLFIHIFKQKKYFDIYKLIPGLIIYLSWKYFALVQGVPVHTFYSGSFEINRLPLLTSLFVTEFANLIRWNLLWIGFTVGSIILLFKKNFSIVLIILMLQLVFYMGIYLYTPYEPRSHVQGSLDRFLLQISPLAMYLTALSFNKYHLK